MNEELGHSRHSRNSGTRTHKAVEGHLALKTFEGHVDTPALKALGYSGTPGTRALGHLRHSDTRRALGHSDTKGTQALGHLSTRRALRHLSTWAIEALEALYLAGS